MDSTTYNMKYIVIPKLEERCRIIPSLDSNLLYRNTEFADIEGERPTVTFDFLEVSEQFHCIKAKTFSGAASVECGRCDDFSSQYLILELRIRNVSSIYSYTS